MDRYEKYLRAEVRELIENYGPLSTMWFDFSQGFSPQRGKGVVEFVRTLQPDILINDRCANAADYGTPEQVVGPLRLDRPWETCMTIGQQWAWKPDDRIKSLRECIQTLVLCAGGDGNLLLNVGPMPDGRIEPRQVERLKEMGQWLARYGKAIYGTRGGPFTPGKRVASTRAGNVVYLHVFQWKDDQLVLPALPKKIVASSLLSGGTVSVRPDGPKLVIRVAPADRQPIDTIVALELDGPAIDIPAIRLPAEL